MNTKFIALVFSIVILVQVILDHYMSHQTKWILYTIAIVTALIFMLAYYWVEMVSQIKLNQRIVTSHILINAFIFITITIISNLSFAMPRRYYRFFAEEDKSLDSNTLFTIVAIIFLLIQICWATWLMINLRKRKRLHSTLPTRQQGQSN